MASRIEELVRVGYSDEQIVDYFVGRYGDWVRLEPPAEGIHLLIFVAPVAVVLVIRSLTRVALPRMRHKVMTAGMATAVSAERVVAVQVAAVCGWWMVGGGGYPRM